MKDGQGKDGRCEDGREAAMKTLYLVRHAEAVPAGPGCSDHERALTPAGHAAAAALGHLLAAELLPPERALSSDARRARETTAGIVAALRQPVSITLDHALYEASGTDLLAAVRALGDAPFERLLLVAHNPAVGELVRLLGTRGRPEAVAKARRGHPPGALAVLRLACHDWEDLWPGAAELWRFVVPAELPLQPPR